MSENSPDSVLGSLPHSRPHRRSEKRAERAGTPATAAPPTTAKPKPKPARPEAARPTPSAPPPPEPQPEAAAPPIEPEQSPGGCPSLPTGTELLGTVVKAAVELAEIGLTVSARALRIAVSRLPRP